MACLEHPLHRGKGALHQGSRSTDGFVPPVLLDREGMATDRAVHGLIHGCPGFHAEIPFIAIDRLAFPGEIDPAVMHRCCGRLDPADELAVFVHEDMELVPKLRH